MKQTNNRAFEWKTHLGNKVTVEGCCDEHLANMIQYITHYRMWADTEEVLILLKEEVKLRGLAQEFLDKAQYPYRDGRGNWIVWDFATGEPKVIGLYKR
jgi:hypothetical protein